MSAVRVRVGLELGEGVTVHFDREVATFGLEIGDYRVVLSDDYLSVRSSVQSVNGTDVLFRIPAKAVRDVRV